MKRQNGTPDRPARPVVKPLSVKASPGQMPGSLILLSERREAPSIQASG
jgi:hypothetical protein